MNRFDFHVGDDKFYKMGVVGKNVNTSMAFKLSKKKRSFPHPKRWGLGESLLGKSKFTSPSYISSTVVTRINV